MKAALIAGVVGLLFMSGGFYFGMRLAPTPKAHAAVAGAKGDATAAAASVPREDPISIDTLKKTSESMMSLDQELQLREKAVAERERKVAQHEDEVAAERQALSRSHENFKSLFTQFQARLNLVEANQVTQLQRQADLYAAMGTAQSIDLFRAMDDPAMVRLFSMMDTKPLSKLVGDWKTKYPADTPRLLHALDDMSRVLPKDKVAITDAENASTNGASTSNGAPAPDGNAPASPADTNAAAPGDGNNATPGTAPASNSSAPDSSAPPPADTNPPPLAPPPDSPNAPTTPSANSANSTT